MTSRKLKMEEDISRLQLKAKLKGGGIMEALTVRQVAEKYNVKPATVVAAVKAGRIRGQKMGWFWVVRKGDLPERWPGRKGK